MTRHESAIPRWFIVRAAAAALAAIAGPLPAQPPCAPPLASERAVAWPAPLGQPVSLRANDVALRDALAHLSATSGVSFAYASDLLAGDRRVCVVADHQPLGQVLNALLAGSGVKPSVVAGRVVLAPTSIDHTARRAEPVDVLARVVVTGNTVATARRALTIGMEVVEGEVLRRQGLRSMAEILDGIAPGAWVWGTTGSVMAQYAGIRGASSFGASAPKLYLDGIEVANPLLFTEVDPDAIDHIEIIRGPQGSALYGSDAISGVINVITRHDGRTSAGSRLMLTSTGGASTSAFGTALVPTLDQRLAMRLGDDMRSAGFAAQFGQAGAVFPSAESRQTTLLADGRVVGRQAVFTGSARLFDRRIGAGQNPLLSGLVTRDSMLATGATTTLTSASPQSAREYTVGGTITRATDGPWTHTLVVGVDGYRIDHVNAAAGLSLGPADSSPYSMRGAGDRTTLRASSVGRFGGEHGHPAATVTVGLEQSVLRLDSPTSSVAAAFIGARDVQPSDSLSRRWNHNVGAFVQTAAAWSDALFFTAGLRMERNDAFTGADREALLPMLGLATVRDLGAASVKLRAAYGRGIRPPSTPARGVPVEERGRGYASEPALDPESQSGTELGAELSVGQTATLQVTRFDQVASGLIQNVLVQADAQMREGRAQRRLRYELQNVGEIANHGWELQGSLSHKALSLSSAVTFVDSRVVNVSSVYGGELRAGDRMLGVPSRTGSLTASWTARDWSGAISASRATHWVNYDRLRLANDYVAAGAGMSDLVGEKLRSYWLAYDGDTHLRITGTRAVRDGLELVLTGDNLLGGQLGEPDNVTIRAGRTITAGVRAGF
jgi:outer membrane receptor for ferrienterochelin and colicin